MWKQRKVKDFFTSELIDGRPRDCISDKTVKELLDRLCLAEGWLLKNLLGEEFVVRAAAINVKIFARRDVLKPEKYYGDLYVVQNPKTDHVSFRLYCPKENKFVWSVDCTSDLEGYVDLKCNTHILHRGNCVYTLKFADRRERSIFRDNLNKFLFMESSKKST